MTHDQILEILNHRHACKEFNPQKKISDTDMEIILKAGQLSPSSMGTEPWKFIVISNQDLLNELIPLTPGGKKQLSTCSHLVIVLSRLANDLKHDSDYMDYLLREVKQMPVESVNGFKKVIAGLEATRFNHNDQALMNYSASQAYIAIANMTLVGAMVGADSCVVGAFDKDSVKDVLVKHQLLDPEHFTLNLMVPFGYRANEITPKKRQPFDQVVTWVK